MADIIKQIDRNIPSKQRLQFFTQADASVGDVILIDKSLGRAAIYIKIIATAAASFRLNVYHKIEKRYDEDAQLDAVSTQSYQTTAVPIITLSDGETFIVNGKLSVQNIEVVSATGDWSILVF